MPSATVFTPGSSCVLSTLLFFRAIAHTLNVTFGLFMASFTSAMYADRSGMTSSNPFPYHKSTIIRDNVIESVRGLKALPGKSILMDGSSQLVHALIAYDLVDELHLLVYPLTLG